MLQTRTNIAIATIAAVFCVAAPAQEVVAPALSELRLRNRIDVVAESVTLGDVLNFADADPRLQAALENKPVFSETSPSGAFDVSHDQIVKRLIELGVNRARVTVSGARTCRVTHHEAGKPVTEQPRPTTKEPGQSLQLAADGEQTATLEGALRNWIAQDTHEFGGRCEVEFELAGQEFLALSSPEYEFSIRPAASSDKLGLREFNVSIRQNGRTQRTLRIATRVQLVKSVLVAVRPLSVGAFIRRDDVRSEERLFSRETDIGLDRAELAIGQQVRAFIEAGAMVTSKNLQSVELVKRSAPVTVIGDSGAVQLRMTGIARDNGRLGDKVRVRVGESRANQREVVGVVTGPGNIRIVSESVACAGGAK